MCALLWCKIACMTVNHSQLENNLHNNHVNIYTCWLILSNSLTHLIINFSECSDDEDTDSEYESNSEVEAMEQQPVGTQYSHLFHWLLILILTWHIAHSISGTAIYELLQFIAKAFSVTGSLLSSPFGMDLSAFPASLYLAYKYLKIDLDDFDKYVLCPNCYSLYD